MATLLVGYSTRSELIAGLTVSRGVHSGASEVPCTIFTEGPLGIRRHVTKLPPVQQSMSIITGYEKHIKPLDAQE